MVICRIIKPDMPKGYVWESTDWQVSLDDQFTNIVLESMSDVDNLSSITFNEKLDLNTKYYGRARINHNKGFTDWSNTDVFFPSDIKEIRLNVEMPSIIASPTITSLLDIDNHPIEFIDCDLSDFLCNGNIKHAMSSVIVEDSDEKVVWSDLTFDPTLNKLQIPIKLNADAIYRIRVSYKGSNNDVSQFGVLTIHTRRESKIKLSGTLFIAPVENIEQTVVLDNPEDMVDSGVHLQLIETSINSIVYDNSSDYLHKWNIDKSLLVADRGYVVKATGNVKGYGLDTTYKMVTIKKSNVAYEYEESVKLEYANYDGVINTDNLYSPVRAGGTSYSERNAIRIAPMNEVDGNFNKKLSIVTIPENRTVNNNMVTMSKHKSRGEVLSINTELPRTEYYDYNYIVMNEASKLVVNYVDKHKSGLPMSINVYDDYVWNGIKPDELLVEDFDVANKAPKKLTIPCSSPNNTYDTIYPIKGVPVTDTTIVYLDGEHKSLYSLNVVSGTLSKIIDLPATIVGNALSINAIPGNKLVIIDFVDGTYVKYDLISRTFNEKRSIQISELVTNDVNRTNFTVTLNDGNVYVVKDKLTDDGVIEDDFLYVYYPRTDSWNKTDIKLPITYYGKPSIRVERMYSLNGKGLAIAIRTLLSSGAISNTLDVVTVVPSNYA